MYWGQLHPKILLGSLLPGAGIELEFPPCMGEPARQIRVEEVNRNYENVNRQIVQDFLGYRLTFELTWASLEAEDLDKVIQVLNFRGAIFLYPWSDQATYYEVISVDPQLDMQYFNDAARLNLQTILLQPVLVTV